MYYLHNDFFITFIRNRVESGTIKTDFLQENDTRSAAMQNSKQTPIV